MVSNPTSSTSPVLRQARTSQYSNDGETGPGAGGSASYLGRARAKVSLSPTDLCEGEGISTLIGLH
jgi:hypothetical protein